MIIPLGIACNYILNRLAIAGYTWKADNDALCSQVSIYLPYSSALWAGAKQRLFIPKFEIDPRPISSKPFSRSRKPNTIWAQLEMIARVMDKEFKRYGITDIGLKPMEEIHGVHETAQVSCEGIFLRAVTDYYIGLDLLLVRFDMMVRLP